MRRVRIEYDCRFCGRKAIYAEVRETKQSDEDLMQEVNSTAFCTNPACEAFDQSKRAKVSRVIAEPVTTAGSPPVSPKRKRKTAAT
jgi:hypothetical protein